LAKQKYAVNCDILRYTKYLY